MVGRVEQTKAQPLFARLTPRGKGAADTLGRDVIYLTRLGSGASSYLFGRSTKRRKQHKPVVSRDQGAGPS